MRISAKHHTHLLTFTKTPVKFQRDSTKIAGGVSCKSVTICDSQMDRRGHMVKPYGTLTGEGGGGHNDKKEFPIVQRDRQRSFW